MSDTNINAIRRFVAGEGTRQEAVAAYHDELRLMLHASGANESALRNRPEILFMGEVDNPCPDYGLRARYRRQVVEQWGGR